MAGQKAEQMLLERQKKEKEVAKKDFDFRKEEFEKGVLELSKKYEIDIAGVIKYGTQGLIPLIGFFDTKGQQKEEAETTAPILEV